MVRSDLKWAYPQPEKNPYQLERDHLIDAVRKDKPYSEAHRGAEASLVTSMGRMAVHTGQLVTWDDILGHTHEFAPTVNKLTVIGDAPLKVALRGTIPIRSRAWCRTGGSDRCRGWPLWLPQGEATLIGCLRGQLRASRSELRPQSPAGSRGMAMRPQRWDFRRPPAATSNPGSGAVRTSRRGSSCRAHYRKRPRCRAARR